MKMPSGRAALAAAVLTAATTLLPAVFGAAFVPLKDVAPVADLESEAQAQLVVLTDLLKSKDSYADEDNRKKRIPRAAGVIAVLGQAIAEHPDKGKVKAKGPDLRDAARGVITAKTFEEATAALAMVKPALEGTSSGKGEADYAWNKLMSLHRLMEEVESRHEALRDVVYPRSNARKPDEDARHAGTLAVLSLAMYADTHEVKNPAEIPEYQGYAKDLRQLSTDLAAAVRRGDSATMKSLYPQTTKICGNCHDRFRK